MALIEDLQRQARAETRLIAVLQDGFEDELASVLGGLTRQVRRLVGQLEAEGGRLVSTQQALGRALGFHVELRAALETAGFSALAEEAFDLDDLAAQTLRGNSVAATSAKLTPINPDLVVALEEIGQADLLQLGDDLAAGLWRGTLDGVIGNRDVADLTEELAEVVGVSERQARTLHDTSVRTFRRQVKQLGLETSPEDRFLYMGPNDSATRPFCRELVGEVRTRAEIDALSNGQLPNSLLTGGGFNCRHVWQFVGEFSLQELGAA